MPYNSSTHPKGKAKLAWIISIVLVLTTITALFWYNRNFLGIYYFNLKHNHFKVNDKLYARDFLINGGEDHKPFDIELYRKIKPINGNPAYKPCVERCDWKISGDSLLKYRTAYIGTYTGAEILSMRTDDGEYYPVLLYSITTNKKALVKTYLADAPKGYEFDDGPLYIWYHEVTGKELQRFERDKR